MASQIQIGMECQLAELVTTLVLQIGGHKEPE
jgi:hypothetical protein